MLSILQPLTRNVLKAYALQEQGNLLEFVDPILGTNYCITEATSMLNIALLCSNPSPSLRPSMSAVVTMLEQNKIVEAPCIGTRSTPNDQMKFKGLKKHALNDSQTQSSREGLGMKSAASKDEPWDDSSVYMPSKDTSTLLEDLYDVHLE